MTNFYQMLSLIFAAVDSYNLFKKRYKNIHFSGPLSNVREVKKNEKNSSRFNDRCIKFKLYAR